MAWRGGRAGGGGGFGWYTGYWSSAPARRLATLFQRLSIGALLASRRNKAHTSPYSASFLRGKALEIASGWKTPLLAPCRTNEVGLERPIGPLTAEGGCAVDDEPRPPRLTRPRGAPRRGWVEQQATSGEGLSLSLGPGPQFLLLYDYGTAAAAAQQLVVLYKILARGPRPTSRWGKGFRARPARHAQAPCRAETQADKQARSRRCCEARSQLLHGGGGGRDNMPPPRRRHSEVLRRLGLPASPTFARRPLGALLSMAATQEGARCWGLGTAFQGPIMSTRRCASTTQSSD